MQKEGVAKAWLKANNLFYANQKAALAPYTHSIIFGGMAVLETKIQYEGLYEKLAVDIVQDDGKFPICERFPCIYGEWRRQDFYPPPHLVMRTLRAFQIPLHEVPEVFFSDELVRQDLRLDRSKQDEWRECILAVDLDYGDYEKSYDMKEILKDVGVFQQVIQECGGSPMSSRCIVCVADQSNTLGVHLYFPFSAYFPEECFYLVSFALWKLRETRPINTKQSKKEWESIVDVSIYDKTLRLPFLYKVKKCKKCLKTQKEATRLLCECKGAGFLFVDRRYWPYGILHPDGTVKEQEWMQAITRYICNKNNSQQPQWMKTAAITNLSATMTEKKCVDFVYMMLLLCSIRIIRPLTHSAFLAQPSLPKPTYPKAWTVFFQSILDQVQRPFLFPVTEYRELSPVDLKPADVNQILKIQCGPSSSPAGILMSSFGQYWKQATKESVENEHERLMREKYGQFLVSPSAPINKETINHYKEFHLVDKPITPSDDPFQKCLSLQTYIRNFTHSEYKELQVIKVTHSSKYGNTLVLVQGVGQHYCMMAGRHHRNNTIFFIITRHDQSLSQRCHHQKCKGLSYNWRKITSSEVRILFTPKEDIALSDSLTPDLKVLAEQVASSNKSLNTPCEKAYKKSKALIKKINNGGIVREAKVVQLSKSNNVKDMATSEIPDNSVNGVGFQNIMSPYLPNHRDRSPSKSKPKKKKRKVEKEEELELNEHGQFVKYHSRKPVSPVMACFSWIAHKEFPKEFPNKEFANTEFPNKDVPLTNENKKEQEEKEKKERKERKGEGFSFYLL